MPDKRVIFMNVGWMTAYQGLTADTISGGGEYVKKHGGGHEIFNFKLYEGRYYGYGRPANDFIDLKRLDIDAPKGSAYVDGVLVVWVANSYVVRWYKNARVYHEWQAPPPGSSRPFGDGKCGYYVTAKKSDCKLLDPDARTLAVPRARDVKGGMGRYVWYAEGAQHKAFLKKLYDFIRADGKTGPRKPGAKTGGGAGWQIDPRRRKRIETAAVREVMRYYGKELGYKIRAYPVNAHTHYIRLTGVPSYPLDAQDGRT